MRKNLWIAMAAAGVFALGCTALAQHGKKHHSGATHMSKSESSKAHAEHAKQLAELKKLLGEAKAAADAGDAKKASRIIAQAQDVVEKMSGGAVVNTKCPIMGGKVDPATVPANLTRTFQGKKVGFCCGGCPSQWDKLSDEEKAKKLAAVTGQ